MSELFQAVEAKLRQQNSEKDRKIYQLWKRFGNQIRIGAEAVKDFQLDEAIVLFCEDPIALPLLQKIQTTYCSRKSIDIEKVIRGENSRNRDERFAHCFETDEEIEFVTAQNSRYIAMIHSVDLHGIVHIVLEDLKEQ